MRLKLTAILCLFFFLTGCSNANDGIEHAHALRNKLLSGNGCSFVANITADYGEELYTFSLSCQADNQGNITFSVLEPQSICGITGTITAQGGKITFDDKAVAFETIADGQITPVTAPWVLMTTLHGGYLNGCSATDDGFLLTIDDSYKDDSLRLNVRIGKDYHPQWAEVFWKNRRVLTLTVENFNFL